MKSTDLDSRAVLDAIRRLVRTLRLASRQAEARLDLSAAQLFVLQQLSMVRPLSMKELARRTHTDQSSVSVVVGRLVAKGLVARKASVKDARVAELRLSQKGQSMLVGQPDAFQSRLLKAMHKMPGAELAALRQGLERLVREAGMAEETPAMLLEEAN